MSTAARGRDHRGREHETDLPAESNKAPPHPWISSAHGNSQRSAGFAAPPAQGPCPFDRLTRVDQRLRRHERLTAPADYTRCYRYGRRLRTRYFTVYAYHHGASVTRLGLAVGKAVGGAVVRNRVKRRLRELFRRRKALGPRGYDLFVRAVPASASASYAALGAAWCEAMALLKVAEAPGHAELQDG
jgi:ribonuclease P protein component